MIHTALVKQIRNTHFTFHVFFFRKLFLLLDFLITQYIAVCPKTFSNRV